MVGNAAVARSLGDRAEAGAPVGLPFRPIARTPGAAARGIVQLKWDRDRRSARPDVEVWTPREHGVTWRRRAGDGGEYLYYVEVSDMGEAKDYYGWQTVIAFPNDYETFEEILNQLDQSEAVPINPVEVPTGGPEEAEAEPPEAAAKEEQQPPPRDWFTEEETVYEHTVEYRTRIKQVCDAAGVGGICTAWSVDWIMGQLAQQPGPEPYGEEAVRRVLAEHKEYLALGALESYCATKGLETAEVGSGRIRGGRCQGLEAVALVPGSAYCLEMNERMVHGRESNGHTVAFQVEPAGLLFFDQNSGLMRISGLARFNVAYKQEIETFKGLGLNLKQWSLTEVKQTADPAQPLAEEDAAPPPIQAGRDELGDPKK